ncbi:MAG: pyridoxal phosphate-dependent aminotransferase [Deltaproteobacteria bacterium]|nr:pyridoxal phosphate-dependent aminotransferase [Deltaproteobacteria bacterium]
MTPKLSDRTRFRLEHNLLARAVADARRPLVDLTESNPTRCGLSPGGEMLGELAHPRGARYEPVAIGMPEARGAVAAYYESRGVQVDPERVVLSASTSEAYGWLFKLLCDRDDAVLVPQPSYPLFEYLATLEDVRLAPYPLLREERFRVDLAALERAIDERTRAILVVHPNNPTGTFARFDEAEALEHLARRNGLALIVDEVFGDYAWGALPGDRLPTFAGRANALTFVLSGLSKVVGLPQLKLGWIVANGPGTALEAAFSRLEVIADTYLSVATPIQLALRAILDNRAGVQGQIRARVADNLAALDRALADHPSVRRLPSDGGWSAILEVPRTRADEAWAELLVREEGVIVHPGWFFELDREGYLVVSLLPEAFPSVIGPVIARLAEG